MIQILYIILVVGAGVALLVGGLYLLLVIIEGGLWPPDGFWASAFIVVLFIGVPLQAWVEWWPQAFGRTAFLSQEMVLIISGICVLIAVLFESVGLRNYLVKESEKIKRSHARLRDLLAHPPAGDLTLMARIVDNHVGAQGEILNPVSRAGDGLKEEPGSERWAESMEKFEHALKEFAALMEVYPSIKEDERLRHTLRRILEREQLIEESLRRLNTRIEVFNSRVRRFPNGPFAFLWGFRPLKYVDRSGES